MSEKLAPGAQAPEGFIPLCAPEIRGNEWAYIKECLDTNWVSSVGSFVDRFEKMVADYIGVEGSVAVVNGTSAIQLALLVVGVEPGDEVLTSTLSFIAPANAIRYVGAYPIFIDCEQNHWQIDANLIMDFFEKECEWCDGVLYNVKTGRRVRAILPVHVLGHPVNMDSIMEVAKKFDLPVIEDAAEAIGARYKSLKVGCLGDIACLSFNGNKIITTGGGGMVVTNNQDWAKKARYLATQAKDDPLEYVHNEIGYNWRLTNIQAAMGCAQMELLEDYVAIKREIADKYYTQLKEVPGITLMHEADWAFSTFWMNTILVDESKYGIGSRELISLLEKAGIQARPLWQPLHRNLAHRGSQVYHHGIAEHLNQQAVSLPSSVGLTEAEQNRVVSLLIQCKTS